MVRGAVVVRDELLEDELEDDRVLELERVLLELVGREVVRVLLELVGRAEEDRVVLELGRAEERVELELELGRAEERVLPELLGRAEERVPLELGRASALVGRWSETASISGAGASTLAFCIARMRTMEDTFMALTSIPDLIDA